MSELTLAMVEKAVVNFCAISGVDLDGEEQELYECLLYELNGGD